MFMTMQSNQSVQIANTVGIKWADAQSFQSIECSLSRNDERSCGQRILKADN